MMAALTLPGLPESASAARKFAARTLAGAPAAEDAVLCADELFCNAIMHSASGLPGGKVTVVVSTAGTSARVDVIDDGPLPPGARVPGGLGQGLVIVSQLADVFGANGPDRWFTVATADRSGEDLSAVAALLDEAGLGAGQAQPDAGGGAGRPIRGDPMSGPVTYDEASGGNLVHQIARYHELADRDLTSRSIATLKARGEWGEDRARVLDPDKYPPLTVAEHLEMLALGEVIARYYRHPSQVGHAVRAGATWEQIAAATGTTEDAARAAYREWVEGQHEHAGMSDAEYAAAVKAAEPGRQLQEEDQ